MVKVLVVGYGSIGARHTKWLSGMGHQVSIVSKQTIDAYPCYPNIQDFFQSQSVDYVVIANETSLHRKTLEELSRTPFAGTVLVEKPLFHDFAPFVIPQQWQGVFLAYNLRFHPIIQRLKILIAENPVIQTQVYVGKYLPSWRTQSRIGYSGSKPAGGGVLRDLSHELDYLVWLLGGWNALTACGGKFSHLDIDSDDAYSILMKTPSCGLVTLEMNYLDQVGRREIIVQQDCRTLKADLYQGYLTINGEREDFNIDSAYTYLEEHKAILSQKTENVCSYAEGWALMKLIEACETAAAKQVWVQK